MDLNNTTISNRYKISHKIGEGGISVVYLAYDLENSNNKAAVKILKEKSTSGRVEDIIRFSSEATTVSRLSHPNIITIYEIGEVGEVYYIAMEFIDGASLYNIIRRSNKLIIEESVNIIMHICRALAYIHDNGIVHRDLKPGNVMIPTNGDDQNIGQLKLIDFGLAQIKEFGEIEGIEEITGTFSYMSPEQSGVIKRNVDERSDLYSLGIIFYQLLTKNLPFQGDSISSIIHQHIAKTPQPLTEFDKDIPNILERIILKLLEKEPERRYQSAKGLLADLEKYSRGEKKFILGLDDRFIKLSYRTNIVGREEEVSKLKNLYDSALSGKGGVCLIDGEAGRGKSRLVEELRDYVYSKGGTFIDGKCFSGENKIPYGPFKDALNVYLKNFNKYSEERKGNITEKTREAVGELGEIISRLNPMMKEIIGECPPLVELEPDRENNRFLTVASRFFLDLGKTENSLVVVFDDLQWSDEGSIELLNEIIQDISKFPLLIIGTYRDNEIMEGHGLRRFIENAKENRYPLDEIHIELFDNKRMNKFISGLLYESEENVEEIADFVLKKSRGNPFFSIEILKQLVNEEAIIYRDKKWTVNYDILNRLEISSSIIDIVLKRLSSLDEKEMNILTYAAAIGRKFDIELLFKLLTEFDNREVVEIVDRAINLQLLEENLSEKGKILFVHDRIKEAFYKNISEEKRKRLHVGIARTIEEINIDNVEDVIFDLSYHYIEGGDKDKSLEYTIPAGRKAKEIYANEEAVKYFNVARELLEEKLLEGDDLNRRLWLKCTEEIGEIYLIIGKNDEAIEIYNEIFPFKNTEYEKAKILRQISTAYFKKGDWGNCESNGRKGLKLLGERLPIKKSAVIFGIIKELLVHIFHNLFPILFIKKRENPESEKHKLIVWFYITLNWSYILSDLLKFMKSTLRMLNYTESKIGKSEELGLSLGAYAGLCMAIPLFKRSIRYNEKALNLRRELSDEWGVAQSLQFTGFCYEWKGEYKKSIDYLKKSILIFKKIGDSREAGMSILGLTHNYYYMSDYDNAKIMNEQYFGISKRSKDNMGIAVYSYENMRAHFERGDFDKAEICGIKGYSLSYEKEIWFVHSISNINLSILLLEKNEIIKSLEYLEKARFLYEKYRLIKQYNIHLYSCLVEAYIKDYKIKDLKFKHKERRKDLIKIKKAAREALSKTKRWLTHYGGALRVNAKYYALIGKNKKAERFFLESMEHCSRLGRRYELAKSFYEYGTFLKQRGREDLAKSKLESAYRIFGEIDSRVYMQRSAALLGIKEEDTSSSQRLMDRQRLSSIIKVSHDISSILNLDELLESVMEKAIEVTGAQRGYLFIYDDELKDIELKASRGIEDIVNAEFSWHVVDDVYKNARTIISVNAEKDEELADFASVVKYGLKSILCVPIKHYERVIGICYLDNSLSSGVFTEEDSGLLTVFMNQAAIAIENASLYENLENKVEERTKELSIAYNKLNIAYSRMKDDLMLAKNIQDNILPRNIEEICGLKFHIEYLPLIEVGGDIYDIHYDDRGFIRIFMSDAIGHGVGASLIAMLIKSEYEKLKLILKNPFEIFDAMNNIFYDTYGSLNIFFTGIIIDIDINLGRILYSSAGHPVQYLIKGKQILQLPKTGRAVGIGSCINCINSELDYRRGDKILLFTDGLFEEFNQEREEFGEERIISIINGNINKSIKDIIELIKENMFNFIEGHELNDDITIIGIE